MNALPVQLENRAGDVLATGMVVFEGEHYAGKVDLSRTPREVRALFQEFEEVVEGQMFSLLDEIEQRIADLGVHVVFENGEARCAKDLQVYPGTATISFALAESPVNRPSTHVGARP